MLKCEKKYHNIIFNNQQFDNKLSNKQDKLENEMLLTKSINSYTDWKLCKANISQERYKNKFIKVIKDKSVLNPIGKNQETYSKKSNSEVKNTQKNINNNNNIFIQEKIINFESRINNLMQVIQNFEDEFIKSPKPNKIKEQFNTIANKISYNEINPIKTDALINTNSCKKLFLKDNHVYDINNINININNNNYGDNFYISKSINNINTQFNNNPNLYSNKLKINLNNNNILKNSINKPNNKKIFTNHSNDMKNQSINSYKDKNKIFHLPLESINNYKNIYLNNKNRKFNNSNKHIHIQMSLTDRKEKFNELNKIMKSVNTKNQFIYKNLELEQNKNIKRNNIDDYFKYSKNNRGKNLTLYLNMNKKSNSNKVKEIKEKQNLGKDQMKFGGGIKSENKNFVNYILYKRNFIKSNDVDNMENEIINYKVSKFLS